MGEVVAAVFEEVPLGERCFVFCGIREERRAVQLAGMAAAGQVTGMNYCQAVAAGERGVSGSVAAIGFVIRASR